MSPAHLHSLLRRLITQSFPRLRRLPLTISWGALEDELLSYSVHQSHHRIRVNEVLRQAPSRVLTAGIVHELCHIDADIRLSPHQRHHAWTRYMNSPWRRMREERATDRRVIQLAYGPELLAFMSYARRLGYRFSKKEGLLYPEIRRAIEASKTRP